MIRFDMIAFDADDTLWHEIENYDNAENQFVKLLSRYHNERWIRERMVETDIRNLKIYGYGAKGFILSMIETAIELTEGRVTGSEIKEILTLGHAILNAPINLIDGVQETVEALSETHTLMIITKGDLMVQETKIARSGLANLFEQIEIVSEKHPDVYRAILKRYSIVPERFLMVGNSLKSDVRPVCAIGGHAIWIPQDNTWVHEQLTHPSDEEKITTLKTIGELPAWVQKSESAARA